MPTLPTTPRSWAFVTAAAFMPRRLVRPVPWTSALVARAERVAAEAERQVVAR